MDGHKKNTSPYNKNGTPSTTSDSTDENGRYQRHHHDRQRSRSLSEAGVSEYNTMNYDEYRQQQHGTAVESPRGSRYHDFSNRYDDDRSQHHYSRSPTLSSNAFYYPNPSSHPPQERHHQSSPPPYPRQQQHHRPIPPQNWHGSQHSKASSSEVMDSPKNPPSPPRNWHDNMRYDAAHTKRSRSTSIDVTNRSNSPPKKQHNPPQRSPSPNKQPHAQKEPQPEISRSERKRRREMKRRSDVNKGFDDLSGMLLRMNPPELLDTTKDVENSIINPASLNRVELMNKSVLVMERLFRENHEMIKSIQELTFQLNQNKKKEKVIMMFPMMIPSDAPCHLGAPVPSNAIPIPPIIPADFLHGFPNTTLYPAPPYQLQPSTTTGSTNTSQQQTSNPRHQWVTRPYSEAQHHESQQSSQNNSSAAAASIMVDMHHNTNNSNRNNNRSSNNSPTAKKRVQFEKKDS